MSEILEITNNNGEVIIKPYDGYISEENYDALHTDSLLLRRIQGRRVILRSRVPKDGPLAEAYNDYQVKLKLTKFLKDE